MNPQTLQLLQMFGGIGGNDLDNSVSEMIQAKAVEVRTDAGIKLSNSGITDPKMVKWAITGKYE
jgi:hypothetical protein